MGAYVYEIGLYLLGGLTLSPLVFGILLLHIWCTSKPYPRQPCKQNDLFDADPAGEDLVKGTEAPGQRGDGENDEDARAGYFALYRDFPASGPCYIRPSKNDDGSTINSLNIYQNVYRSIFDRKTPTNLGNVAITARNESTERAPNVFYVTIRNGHLVLFSDQTQLHTKLVISLEQYSICVDGGNGSAVPEGELWMKYNAIRLQKKVAVNETIPRPYLLFSQDCSFKEDFYLALLAEQKKYSSRSNDCRIPNPLLTDSAQMMTLFRSLHSSEDQLNTRWLNALLGRLFLALRETPEAMTLTRAKLERKMSRVKMPSMLSNIVLGPIHLGNSAPQILSPKLRDLSIDGTCCIDFDFCYTGQFRIEVAALARLDLGARFKAREINLVLAIVVKRLQGHGLLKLKPAPSNRLWMAFETMPRLELTVEPVVGSKQITYGLIHRVIESRIKEVIADTIVLPNWDDIPFLDTAHKLFRGGIWSAHSHVAVEPETAAEDSADQDQGHFGGEAGARSASRASSFEKKSWQSRTQEATADQSTIDGIPKSPNAVRARPHMDKPPLSPTLRNRPLRSPSTASAADPLLSLPDSASNLAFSGDGSKSMTLPAAPAVVGGLQNNLETGPQSTSSTPANSQRIRQADYHEREKASKLSHAGSRSSLKDLSSEIETEKPGGIHEVLMKESPSNVRSLPSGPRKTPEALAQALGNLSNRWNRGSRARNVGDTGN